MALKRGFPEGSLIGQCPDCDEAEPSRFVQIALDRVVCECCGTIFDPRTGFVETDPHNEENE